MQPLSPIAFILCLAAVVTASPYPLAPSIIERGEEQIHVFKRDAAMTPDDLILAENYGVNATEMFKHSVIKRRGEEDVTIWVDNSFEETLGPEENLATPKRALKIIDNYSHSNGWAQERCKGHVYNDNTGPNAPCTGGLKELRTWAGQNNGAFYFEASGNPWRTLVVAGSNTGCNGRIRAQKVSTWGAPGTGIGNADIYYIVDGSLSRFGRVYDGRERMRSHGHSFCGFDHGSRMNWQVTDWADRI
ncbi:hypothetical protein FSPOR_8085 [Fusarium sporotrichioides]|uniref:Uncharacterized protein n=1 Tax=Fusarium sporotrichioides TaxID=5514 RepID=A0A395RVZ5_FUSSP|nr:hypothetical protein FSPOR_8085 [Fusarium sporotrichioides]